MFITLVSGLLLGSSAAIAARPEITDVSVIDISSTGVTVTWTLDQPATGQVEYGTTTEYGEATTPETSFEYSTHIQRIKGLEAGTEYHYRVRSSNAAGEETVSKDGTFTTDGAARPRPTPEPTPKPTPRPTPEPTGPRITEISVLDVSRTGVTLTWTLDEPATGEVEYGPTTDYGQRTTPELSLDYLTHVQRIKDLKPGTEYHYRVRSSNAAGKETVSNDRTFTTLVQASPTPSPTATPRPTPTATPGPTATPVPTATPRPTPTPVPPSGVTTVPASIDATCGTDVSGALNTWIAGRPAGSMLRFPSGACYRFSGGSGLVLKGRSGLTIEGEGATLRIRTTGASNLSAGIFIQDSRNITIRGLTVDGGNTATGTTAARAAIDESLSGAVIRAGSQDIEFDGVSLDRMYGFGIIISDDGRAGDWPEDIHIHDSLIRGGEQGIAITAGRRIQLVGNRVEDSVYTAFDLEPDSASHGFEDVLISGNTVRAYSWGQSSTSWFVAANPADAIVGSVVMDRLSIIGNRVERGAATADNGNFDGLGGLGIRADKSNLKRDLVIRDNWTSDDDTQSSGRAVINLANVRNLTVTGNRQPTKNGAALVRDSGTSGTRTVSGNDTAP